MSIERRVYVRCDGCGTKLRCPEPDELRAKAFARGKGWRDVVLHYTGITAEFCPACCAGRRDAELVEMAMREDRP